MTDLRTAAQQALEALDEATNYTSCPTWSPSMTEECKAAVAALRAALAEPAQEPVAWALHTGTKQGIKWNRRVEHGTPLYTAPPQRTPLTVMDLQEALVYTNLIDRDAIDDPEGYDEGSTLAQIDALHQMLTPPQRKPRHVSYVCPQCHWSLDERKPLTEEEIALIVADCSASAHRHDDFSFARAIERAHGIGGQP